ncbi:MAG: HAMP domain-containing histidine kinase, partial [Vallitaleaceae bacterium]|nr:HAMP domain-containing histidine kinase [Vallitaleaceae bacterium]
SIFDGSSVVTVMDKNLIHQQVKLINKISHKDTEAYSYETTCPTKGAQWRLYGEKLENGKFAMLEIPIESIENTLDIVEKFFSYLVLLSVVIAGIFSVILSRNIAKPVAELNEIAREMGRLNFNKKYLGKRNDEIGQLGQTLNDLTTRLEHTINELQRELDKEKQLDVLRKSFIAQVSHELQTPLSVINGYIEALEDDLVDTEEEKKYYYEIIEDEASKMSKMIRELLDLSQLEAGTFRMQREPLDVTSLLDEISHKYEKIAQAKDIKWHYKNMKEKVMIMADVVRIEQAFTNIITNAFKHTEEKGQIKVLTFLRNDQLHLVIENEGDSIPEEELGHIWESFYKAQTSSGKAGTGLGLAIASNIFKVHQIEYRAYNTDNGVGFELIMDCLSPRNG